MVETAQLLRTRHEVRLLLGPFDPRATFPEVAELPSERAAGIQWLVRRVEADAVVANSFGANLLALRNGPRVAYWVHSLRSVFLTQRPTRPGLLARRVLDLAAARRARLLIANSRYTAKRIRRLYGREASAVVYPGVDLGLYHPEPGATVARRLVSVGRLSPEKHVDDLLAVARALPDSTLHIVGGGPADDANRLRALAPANVRFHGALPPEETARLVSSATVAVFASEAEEFGIAAAEALACGVPVVARSGGGIGEVVEDGVSGVLVERPSDLAAAVADLLGDHSRWERLAEQAADSRGRFTWAAAADGLERACCLLAGLPPPGTAAPPEQPPPR